MKGVQLWYARRLPSPGASVKSIDLREYDPIWQGRLSGSDLEICERLFACTNTQQRDNGFMLSASERVRFPRERSHSSMSVGDVVVVEGRVYVCAAFGFDRIETSPAGMESVTWPSN